MKKIARGLGVQTVRPIGYCRGTYLSVENMVWAGAQATPETLRQRLNTWIYQWKTIPHRPPPPFSWPLLSPSQKKYGTEQG